MKLASIAMPGDELPSGHDGAGFIVDERSVGGDPQIACVHRLNAVKTMMCALFSTVPKHDACHSRMCC